LEPPLLFAVSSVIDIELAVVFFDLRVKTIELVELRDVAFCGFYVFADVLDGGS
jgi:hypothetical protein